MGGGLNNQSRSESTKPTMEKRVCVFIGSLCTYGGGGRGEEGGG